MRVQEKHAPPARWLNEQAWAPQATETSKLLAFSDTKETKKRAQEGKKGIL